MNHENNSQQVEIPESIIPLINHSRGVLYNSFTYLLWLFLMFFLPMLGISFISENAFIISFLISTGITFLIKFPKIGEYENDRSAIRILKLASAGNFPRLRKSALGALVTCLLPVLYLIFVIAMLIKYDQPLVEVVVFALIAISAIIILNSCFKLYILLGNNDYLEQVKSDARKCIEEHPDVLTPPAPVRGYKGYVTANLIFAIVNIAIGCTFLPGGSFTFSFTAVAPVVLLFFLGLCLVTGITNIVYIIERIREPKDKR